MQTSVIVRLVHELEQRPADPLVPPAFIRTYAGQQDIEPWLGIRNAAFAFLGGRPWTTGDFRREFLSQPWWPAATLWLAEIRSPDCQRLDLTGAASPRSGERAVCVGSVLLAPATRDPDGAVLRWLAVHPAWQRRGIARLLVTRAEQAAWDARRPRILVETHARWTAALSFYTACGYRLIDRT